MNFFKKMNLKWKLTAGFSVPLILLVLIATTVNSSLTKLLEHNDRVNHTHKVIETGNEIAAAVVNMETGLRGYLITGEASFLQPYNQGKEQFQALINASKKLVSDNPSQVNKLIEIERIKQDWQNNNVSVAMGIRHDVNNGTTSIARISDFVKSAIGKTYIDNIRVVINDFIDTERVLIGLRDLEQHQTASLTQDITLYGTLIALFFGASAALLIIFNMAKLIGGEPVYAIKAASRIAEGNLRSEVETHPSDTHSILYAMKVMREQLLKRNLLDQTQAAETSRIKSALDVCNTNVMVTDANFDIIYLNDSALSMMKAAEADLKTALPDFNADELLNTNVSTFYTDPAYQKALLEGLQTTHNGEISIGGHIFGLIATPVYSETNERLGTVVEWEDKTERLANEKIVKQQAAANARVKSALDVCDTNVMMADTNFDIIYMNNAFISMMHAAETDLKTAIPNFDANNLAGSSIDTFHEDSAHQREIIENLTSTYKEKITLGGRTFSLVSTPIFDDHQTRLGTVIEWDDMTERLAQEVEDKRLADQNASIKLALDVCATNVMMADNEITINYMNTAVQDMMRAAESDLKSVLPNFSADNLIGSTLDIFQKSTAKQRGVMAALQSTFKTEMKIGPRTFGIIATPIFNSQKERLGTVVEWNDRTAEVNIENEMSALINAANDGDLSQRLTTKNKKGFFKSFSEDLNTLMNSTEAFIGDVSQVFEAMSAGDLSHLIESEYRGEFNRIKMNANDSVSKLSEVLNKIQSSSRMVEASAMEVSQGTDDLSQRTESQASSLEETASSMEEITATVRQTSENATQSNSLAAEAKVKAQQGGEVVQGAVIAMSEILDSSHKINDIIGVIDEIAFQTNLLALNAAVEAARAGELGRGFAVVAGEVRTLSQRSAAAAKEIKNLIRDSVSKVESGSALVNRSGVMLTEIVQAVDNVANMINDVNNAAKEQNSGINQINQAITQMDEMTQQNAALVEESSAASRAMSEEARNMNSMIGFFKIEQTIDTPYYADKPEPIIKYQSIPKISPPLNLNKDRDGAASFSNNDEWEDF